MPSLNAQKRERRSGRWTEARGTTLVELTVAVAIMATVFAAVLPLFAGIRNSAETRWAGLKMVQNARVLNEQLCRYLAQARKVVAVSASMEQAGYIEFEGQEGTVYRCALDTDGRIVFGPVGKLHELAASAEYLRFACYGDTDFDTPMQTPEDIRLVTWEAGFQDRGQFARGKSIAGACCLRIDSQSGDR